MTYNYYPPQSYLEHYGIRGQRWGKKNGPPYPLDPETDYSKAERSAQKKAFKDLKKSHKNYAGQPLRTSDEFKQKAEKYASSLIRDEDLNELKRLRDDMNKKAIFYDFYDSKLFEEANRKAYEETYKWFEDNDPQYLEDIYKEHGKSVDLTFFHDFRKTNEGYQDHYWSIYEKKWNQSPEGKEAKKKEKEWNNAFHSYYNKCEEISKSLLGKYGNKKLRDRDYTYNDLLSSNIDIDKIFKTKIP